MSTRHCPGTESSIASCLSSQGEEWGGVPRACVSRSPRRSWMSAPTGLAGSLLLASVVGIGTSLARAGVGPGPIVPLAVEGLPTPGSGGAPVTLLNSPVATPGGRIAFTGAILGGFRGSNHFVWIDGSIVWLNSDGFPRSLSGAESTMGHADDGSWVYSPQIGGLDAAWGSDGPILAEDDPAPGFPGQFIAFCSRPQMNADGTPTWISGITPTQGGASAFRALYEDGTVVLAPGLFLFGGTIAGGTSSIGFAYDFSPNGQHRVVKAVIEAPNTSSDDVWIVDDAVVAREGQPAGNGAAWQGFGECSINDSGRFVFTGDTDAAAASDGYLAYDGAIVLSEGDVIFGLGTLTGSPSAVAINEFNRVAVIWGSSGGEALLLFDANVGFYGTHLILLRVGDPVDVDGDGDADGTISDFNASTGVGPGIALARQCRVCVEVDVLLSVGGEVEAIVCAALPTVPEAVDLDGDGLVTGSDLGLLLSQWGGPGIADLTCDGVVDGADLGTLLSAWGNCFGGPQCACFRADHACCEIGGAGCTDSACCTAVCAVDIACCQASWDFDCVLMAQSQCGIAPCPPAACLTAINDCCSPGPFPGGGCSDVVCCQAVCAQYPFCCDNSWDSLCVDAADVLCGGCPPAACASSDHGCCTVGGPGCTYGECCQVVCEQDSFCCDTAWDGDCVGMADDLCGFPCTVCTSANHDCCTEGGPGCTEVDCCQIVCGSDPFCCDVVWDGLCVIRAYSLCGGCPPAACASSDHDCCTEGGPGCSDLECCQAVCALDSFCCGVAWDDVCVAEADDLCGLLPCFACFSANHDCCTMGVPGCTDIECCQAVCEQNAYCCDTFWDSSCTADADLYCGLPCDVCNSADHACCAEGGPGCTDIGCCQAVCAVDPYCCDFAWDGVCVSGADFYCDLPCDACKNADHDCFTTGGPGCSDIECCSEVCASLPGCCDQGWDAVCVVVAQDFICN